MRFITATSIFLLCTLFAIPPVFADQFSVENIAVDVEGENTIAARDKALVKARRDAYNILTSRLLKAEERNRVSGADDSTIATLVDNFEINREKLSQKRYLANISIHFNPQAVRGYMGRYTNMAVTDNYTQANQLPTQPNPQQYNPTEIGQVGNTLLLPWYGEGTNVTLWRDTNPWKQAWSTYLRSSPAQNLKLVLPIGDVTDMQFFNPQKPLNYDQGSLDRLLQRYNADTAIIAMADPLPNGMTRVSLYQSTTMMPRFIDRFVVPAPNSDKNANSLYPAIYKTIDSVETADLAPTNTQGSDIALNDTSSFAVDNTAYTPIEAEIRLSSLQQWIGIKQSLNMVNGVNNIEVRSLSANRAVIAFEYSGNNDALRRALRQRGLALSNNPNQYNGASPYLITQG